MVWFRLEPNEPTWKPPVGPAYHVLTESPSVSAGFEPVLLSLPSPFGFSGAAMSEEIGARPSLQQPLGPVQFLTRSDYRPSADWQAADPLAPPGPSVSSRALDDMPPGGGVIDPSFWHWSDRVTIEVSGDATAADLQRTDLPVSLAGEEAAAWVVEASLEFDADGAVRHVFIEQASANADPDGLLLRSLYGWRLSREANHGASETRVLVRMARTHVGAAPADPQPAGAP